MAKAGRKPKPVGSPKQPLSKSHRDKIQNSNILSRLIKHAEGTEDMTSTEVNAALGLLKKCLPDMKAIEHSGSLAVTHESALDELE